MSKNPITPTFTNNNPRSAQGRKKPTITERNRVLRWQGWGLIALGAFVILIAGFGDGTRIPWLQILAPLVGTLLLTIAALRCPHEAQGAQNEVNQA